MVDLPIALLIALSFVTALIGTLGGLGGALILVPVLVLLGVEPDTSRTEVSVASFSETFSGAWMRRYAALMAVLDAEQDTSGFRTHQTYNTLPSSGRPVRGAS